MDEPLILHLECAVQGALSCAVSCGSQVLSSQKILGGASASSALMPLVQNILKAEGIKPTELSAIAVSAGPGSFTGLRIGIASARGYALALGLPVIFVSTLQIIAIEALSKSQNQFPISVLMDARRMECYAGVYDCNGQSLVPAAPIIANQANPIQSFMNESEEFLLAGDGVQKWIEAGLTGNGKPTGIIYPDAAYMVSLATKAFRKKEFASIYQEPFYLKEGNSKS